jgi:glycosyltransferase involved in cell wall biosynthesis
LAGDDGRLRVAVVAPPWYEIPPDTYGGVERVCSLLVDGLVDLGHDVTLIASGRNHTRGRFVQTLEHPPGEGGDLESLTDVLHAARALEAIDQLDVDVAHDHSLAGPLTARARAAPTVVTAHMPVAGPESRLDYFEAIGRDVSLVALSESQRLDAPHLPWVGVVPNGIEIERHPFRESKDDYVLYLGRISATKGVEHAIRAARDAGRRLLIAGKGTLPFEERYFENEIAPALDDRVEWVGEVGGDRKLDLLAGARCLIFPVRWREPFGLVLLEAMACGTPVVALAEGAVPEVVEDGRTGILCRDPSDLPAAIERSGDLDPYECRAHVARRFTARGMAERYEAVYRRVLAGAAPRAPSRDAFDPS